MRILWLTWKDRKHPAAGGAEVVNEELAKRLAKDGHEVVFLTSKFEGGNEEESRDGFKIIRRGGRFSVYWKAYRYYRKNLKGKFDLVIDEMNTIPFFAKFYVKEKNVMFVHQLCREIWFYQMSYPLSLIGYLLEPIYLWLLSDREVITISESTKKDLIRFGFNAKKIHIIGEGIEMEPVKDLSTIKKFDVPTILALGAIRPMKRTSHVLTAFETVKKTVPNARLILAGSEEGKYGEKVLARAKRSEYASDIEYAGKVDAARKMELMQKSHLLCVTSVKEGWGLVVTEANSQGTPAVVYDVDGLRDSVKEGETGSIASEYNEQDLPNRIAKLLQNTPRYSTIRKNAWEWSKEITFDKSYKQFMDTLKYVQ